MKPIIDFKKLDEMQRFRIHLLKKEVAMNNKGLIKDKMLALIEKIFGSFVLILVLLVRNLILGVGHFLKVHTLL